MPVKPATWIVYHGGPLDGAFEKRAKGQRLSSGRDDLGQPLTGNSVTHQKCLVAAGRRGTKHYLLAPVKGDTAIYVHATIYTEWEKNR